MAIGEGRTAQDEQKLEVPELSVDGLNALLDHGAALLIQAARHHASPQYQSDISGGTGPANPYRGRAQSVSDVLDQLLPLPDSSSWYQQMLQRSVDPTTPQPGTEELDRPSYISGVSKTNE